MQNSRKNALEFTNSKNPAFGTTRRKKSEIRCLPASVKGVSETSLADFVNAKILEKIRALGYPDFQW